MDEGFTCRPGEDGRLICGVPGTVPGSDTTPADVRKTSFRTRSTYLQALRRLLHPHHPRSPLDRYYRSDSCVQY